MKKAIAPLPLYDILAEKTAEAIEFLRSHEPQEGYFVGFSGGKDSIVTLKLCEMSGVKHTPYYSCTRIEYPYMYSFIRRNYPQVQWLFPRVTFFNAIRRKGLPFRNARWCCDTLKKAPAKDIPLPWRVMGIRAEESTRRASRPRVDHINNNYTILKPIFAWTEADVWSFIERYTLPYPDLYDQGMGRIGCIFCPFMRPAAMAQAVKTFPTFMRAVKRAARYHFESKKRNTYLYQHDFELYWEDYLLGFKNGIKERERQKFEAVNGLKLEGKI